jgi:transposase
MEVLVQRGAGVDVHKESLMVCLMTTEGREVVKQLRRFSSFHRDLVLLREWLDQMRITHVAMEATGEYWKPIYEALEGRVCLVVANAQHVKNVPGRKSDPEDAAWLARLLRHGMLQPSFVPARPVRELRDFTRLRRKTIEMSARIENRAQKVLEASGIKLGSVLSDVFGVTGRAILKELAANRTDPVALAQLARGTLKKKKAHISVALESTFDAHDAMLLEHQLILHEQLQQRRTTIEAQLLLLAEPYNELIGRLDQMPGINRDAAIEILGEIGHDMSPWPDHDHLAAWSGLCPGNHESAGKRRNIAARKGNPFLKAILIQAASAAVRTKGSYYQAKFARLCRRRGYKRAIVAVAHSMLVAIYHIIRDGRPYRELGSEWIPKRSAAMKRRSLIKQLERLGYSVELRSA